MGEHENKLTLVVIVFQFFRVRGGRNISLFTTSSATVFDIVQRYTMRLDFTPCLDQTVGWESVLCHSACPRVFRA